MVDRRLPGAITRGLGRVRLPAGREAPAAATTPTHGPRPTPQVKEILNDFN
jgi:hypothetical protein